MYYDEVENIYKEVRAKIGEYEEIMGPNNVYAYDSLVKYLEIMEEIRTELTNLDKLKKKYRKIIDLEEKIRKLASKYLSSKNNIFRLVNRILKEHNK